jgi:hypothetical protein
MNFDCGRFQQHVYETLKDRGYKSSSPDEFSQVVENSWNSAKRQYSGILRRSLNRLLSIEDGRVVLGDYDDFAEKVVSEYETYKKALKSVSKVSEANIYDQVLTEQLLMISERDFAVLKSIFEDINQVRDEHFVQLKEVLLNLPQPLRDVLLSRVVEGLQVESGRLQGFIDAEAQAAVGKFLTEVHGWTDGFLAPSTAVVFGRLVELDELMKKTIKGGLKEKEKEALGNIVRYYFGSNLKQQEMNQLRRPAALLAAVDYLKAVRSYDPNSALSAAFVRYLDDYLLTPFVGQRKTVDLNFSLTSFDKMNLLRNLYYKFLYGTKIEEDIGNFPYGDFYRFVEDEFRLNIRGSGDVKPFGFQSPSQPQPQVQVQAQPQTSLQQPQPPPVPAGGRRGRGSKKQQQQQQPQTQIQQQPQPPPSATPPQQLQTLPVVNYDYAEDAVAGVLRKMVKDVKLSDDDEFFDKVFQATHKNLLRMYIIGYRRFLRKALDNITVRGATAEQRQKLEQLREAFAVEYYKRLFEYLRRKIDAGDTAELQHRLYGLKDLSALGQKESGQPEMIAKFLEGNAGYRPKGLIEYAKTKLNWSDDDIPNDLIEADIAELFRLVKQKYQNVQLPQFKRMAALVKKYHNEYKPALEAQQQGQQRGQKIDSSLINTELAEVIVFLRQMIPNFDIDFSGALAGAGRKHTVFGLANAFERRFGGRELNTWIHYLEQHPDINALLRTQRSQFAQTTQTSTTATTATQTATIQPTTSAAQTASGATQTATTQSAAQTTTSTQAGTAVSHSAQAGGAADTAASQADTGMALTAPDEEAQSAVATTAPSDTGTPPPPSFEDDIEIPEETIRAFEDLTPEERRLYLGEEPPSGVDVPSGGGVSEPPPSGGLPPIMGGEPPSGGGQTRMEFENPFENLPQFRPDEEFMSRMTPIVQNMAPLIHQAMRKDMGDLPEILHRGLLRMVMDDVNLDEPYREIFEFLNEISTQSSGHIIPPEILKRIAKRSLYFEVKREGGRIYLGLRHTGRRLYEVLRQHAAQEHSEKPFHHLLHPYFLINHLLWRDLLSAMYDVGQTGAMERLIDHILNLRIAYYPSYNWAQAMTWLIGFHGQEQAIRGMLDVIKPEVFDEWANLMTEMTKYMFVVKFLENTIKQSKMLYLWDEEGKQVIVLEGDWYQLGIGEKLDIAAEILNSPERTKQVLSQYRTMIQYPEEEGLLNYLHRVVSEGWNDPNELYVYVSNPLITAELIKFAEDYGVLNMNRVAVLGRWLYEYFADLYALYRHNPKFFKEMMAVSPIGFDADPIRGYLKFLRDVLMVRGGKEEVSLANQIDTLLDTSKNMVGKDIYTTLTTGEGQLKEVFEESWKHVISLGMVLYGGFNEIIRQNPLEIMLPVFAKMADKLSYSVIRYDGLHPQFFSLRTALKAELPHVPDEYVEDFLVRLMQYMPDEYRDRVSLHILSNTMNKFDIYLHKAFLDLFQEPLINRKTVWDIVNDFFKSALVAWSPITQMRNFFTNTLLVRTLTGEGWYRVLAEMRKSAKMMGNSRLWFEASMISPSFNPKIATDFPEGAKELEYITSGLFRFHKGVERFFRFTRGLAKAGAYAEALGKFTALRMLLDKAGKAETYTLRDLIHYIPRVEEWLVDYRVVPPSIHFLRKGLGLFPFITFWYTIASALVRHPAAGLEAMVEAAKWRDLFAKAMGSTTSTTTEEQNRQLLPEYMRNNPFVVSVGEGDKLKFIDLSYMVPVGIFEAFYDVVEAKNSGEFISALKGSSWEVVKQQVGSILRPLLEAAANRSILTGNQIYNEYDPEEVKAKSVREYLVNMIPMLRVGLNAAKVFGVDFGVDLGDMQKSMVEYNIEDLDFVGRIFGMRQFKIPYAALKRFDEYEKRIRYLESSITKVENDVSKPDHEVAQLIQQYLAEIERLEQEYEKMAKVLVPYVMPFAERIPAEKFDPDLTPYERLKGRLLMFSGGEVDLDDEESNE